MTQLRICGPSLYDDNADDADADADAAADDDDDKPVWPNWAVGAPFRSVRLIHTLCA